MSGPFSLGNINRIERDIALIALCATVSSLLKLFDVTPDPSMTDEKMRQKDQSIFSPWDESS